MRHLHLHIAVYTFLIVLVACKKEEIQSNTSSLPLLKVMQVDEPFYARDVLELNDSSIIIGAVAPINGKFDEYNNPSSDSPSLLTKYAANGNLLWQLELPEPVHVLWQSIELENGNIAVVGLNSEDNSRQVGLAIISPQGDVLNQASYYNVTNQFPVRQINPVDFIELSTGNIAVVTSTSNVPAGMYIAARLVVFDPLLNIVFDRIYTSDEIVLSRPPAQISIVEDAAGDLILHGLDLMVSASNNDDFGKIHAFALKLSAETYDPVYHQLFKNEQKFSSSNIALDNSGKLVWAACGPLAADSLYYSWFNFRNQEVFLIGPEITVWQTNGDSTTTQKRQFSGFPKYGFINKLINTSDGGYMLLGTCNINPNQQISSEYQIMMIKISADYTMEWMRFPKTNSQSISSDIVETSSGYLVSATHLSLGEQSRPIVFKTDKNGIIK